MTRKYDLVVIGAGTAAMVRQAGSARRDEPSRSPTIARSVAPAHCEAAIPGSCSSVPPQRSTR